MDNYGNLSYSAKYEFDGDRYRRTGSGCAIAESSQSPQCSQDKVVQYKTIGNTMFTVVSYYSGTKTYTETVKDVLKMELNKT